MKENPGNNSIIDNNLNASKSIAEEDFQMSINLLLILIKGIRN